MLPNETDEFIDLFPRVRDESLALLLGHTREEYTRFVERLPTQARDWDYLSRRLGRLVTDILPAFGRYRAAEKGCTEIYAYENASGAIGTTTTTLAGLATQESGHIRSSVFQLSSCLVSHPPQK